MTNHRLSDGEAKAVLNRWPTRTRDLWPPPGGRGFWVQGQPKNGVQSGPRLSSPGAKLFKTQPDGLWVHFRDSTSCDVIVVEVCGTIQNLNDKRSRYIPASHSLVLSCSRAWLHEEVDNKGGGTIIRWRAAGSFEKAPPKDLVVSVRHLRVLYALPNEIYHRWCAEHVPTGYEFFCPHSSLASYNSQKMQSFLRQMSAAAQFYTKVRSTG